MESETKTKRKKIKCQIDDCQCICHIRKKQRIIKRLKKPVENINVVIKKAGIVDFND